MKKVTMLLATFLALAVGSWWALTRGAHFELRGYSPSERMQVLDTTTVGEQWMLAGLMLAVLAASALTLAAVAFVRGRKKAIA